MASIAPVRQPSRNALFAGVVLMACLGVALFATNREFTLLEDEAQIARVATLPARVFVQAFREGEGVHEHPPLSDLLLHAWIATGTRSVAALRAPGIVCYLAGVLILAFVARDYSGDRGFLALILIAALWPFAFHFARLIGWYGLAFLLVALLTFFYVRFISKRHWYWWAAWVAAAVALLYTSYAGWIFMALFAVDFVLFERRSASPALRIPLLLTPMILAAAFWPFWTIFLTLLHWRAGTTTPLNALANLGYAGYVVFASESIAPWFFAFSIPVATAIVFAVIAAFVSAWGLPRRLLLYFGVLLVTLAAAGILNTKRLLFLCPWLLVPLATAAVQASRRQRIALMTALGVVAAIGWFGIITRTRYASPHFLEPWPQVAADLSAVIRDGATVVAIHPSLFFYLREDLDATDIPIHEPADLPRAHYRVFDAAAWLDSGAPLSPHVVLVQSVSVPRSAYLDDAEQRLGSRCSLHSDQKLARDAGYRWKQRFFPASGQREWRIEILGYDCAP